MIFTNYLERVLGSKAKIKILRTVYKIPEKGWTSRELSMFIGISHTAVLKSLPDLIDMNILKI